ncbi:hypothetical protein ScPMuIL_015478 [Solemya velum]
MLKDVPMTGVALGPCTITGTPKPTVSPRYAEYEPLQHQYCLMDPSAQGTAWLLARYINRSNVIESTDQSQDANTQQVSLWSAFNLVLSMSTKKIDNIHALPLINAPPQDWDTLVTALAGLNKLNQMVGNDNLPQPVCAWLDMDLYKSAFKLAYLQQDAYADKWILSPGQIHIALCALRCLGKTVEGSGLDELWVERGLYDTAVVSQILSGNHFSLAFRCHQITLHVFSDLHFEAFFGEHPEIYPAKKDAAPQELTWPKNINKTHKADEGIDGITTSPETPLKYCLSTAELSRLSKETEDMFGLASELPTRHHDLSQRKLQQQEKQVHGLKEVLRKSNPLKIGETCDMTEDKLVHLTKNIIIREDVQDNIFSVRWFPMKLFDGDGQLYNFQVCLVVTVCVWFSSFSKGNTEPANSHYLLPGMRGVADAGYYLQVVPQDPATHTVTITMGVSENGSVVEHSVDNETNFRIPIGSTGIDTSLRITLDEVILLTLSTEGNAYITPNRGDTLALLSSSALGTEYIVVSENDDGNSSIYVYGTQDNTTVHVYKQYMSGDSIENGSEPKSDYYELSAQSSILLTPSLGGDALRITSDKPVAVLAVCDNRSMNMEGNKSLSDYKNEGNFTWEMMSPSTAWGRHFILVTPSVTEEIHLKIAGANASTITVSLSNGTKTYLTAAFEVLSLNVTGANFCAIRSSQPVEVLVIAAIVSFEGIIYRNVFTLPPMENTFVCQRIAVTDCYNHECLLVAITNFTSVAFVDGLCDFDISNTSFQTGDNIYSVSRYSNLSNGLYIIHSLDQSYSFISFRLDRTKGSFYPTGLLESYLSEQTPRSTNSNATDKVVTKNCYDTIDGSETGDKSTAAEEENQTNKCTKETIVKSVNPNPWGFTDSDDDDKAFSEYRVAVIVSLCAAIFAVGALISAFLLIEFMKRRKQLRNTKIRPFVS